MNHLPTLLALALMASGCAGRVSLGDNGTGNDNLLGGDAAQGAETAAVDSASTTTDVSRDTRESTFGTCPVIATLGCGDQATCEKWCADGAATRQGGCQACATDFDDAGAPTYWANMTTVATDCRCPTHTCRGRVALWETDLAKVEAACAQATGDCHICPLGVDSAGAPTSWAAMTDPASCGCPRPDVQM